MAEEEDRIALFLDFENLALGARDRGRSSTCRLSPTRCLSEGES